MLCSDTIKKKIINGFSIELNEIVSIINILENKLKNDLIKQIEIDNYNIFETNIVKDMSDLLSNCSDKIINMKAILNEIRINPIINKKEKDISPSLNQINIDTQNDTKNQKETEFQNNSYIESDILLNIQSVEGEEAIELNNKVVAIINEVLKYDEKKIDIFRQEAILYGKGSKDATSFYKYLQSQIPQDIIDSIIYEFAKLLTSYDLRISLLKVHVNNKQKITEICENVSTVAFETKNLEDTLKPELNLEIINHLIFIIHGIGQHFDFKDGEYKSWDGNSGLDGGNHTFRDLFRNMIQTTFKQIPLSLEIQSIEWHDELHVPTGVDKIFERICPEGATSIREFNKETLMDILYYLSPVYGQIIIDTVTKQMNRKYKKFLQNHPGWDGKVSIFAHSLGSVIAYDILTHKEGEISKNGIKFSSLDFQVENFFAAGSPVPVMILSREDLKFNELNDEMTNYNLSTDFNYFNIFHPVDPIAYRLEPLVKANMSDQSPIQIMSADTAKKHDFRKLQEIWQRMMTPSKGFNRIDYVVKRRKREGMIPEFAFAAASHSSYWENEDIVLFTLMQICHPVINILSKYTTAKLPLPKLIPPSSSLTPLSSVICIGNASIRDKCTGLPVEYTIVLTKDSKWLHLFKSRLNGILIKKKLSITLTYDTIVEYGEDAHSIAIYKKKRNDLISTLSISNSNILKSNSELSFTNDTMSSNYSDSSIDETTNNDFYFYLKADNVSIRDEWLENIKNVIKDLKPGEVKLCKQSTRNMLTVSQKEQGLSMDYFNSIYYGSIYFKRMKKKNWYDYTWSSRWAVLSKDSKFHFYENEPLLESSYQFYIGNKNMKVEAIRDAYFFRIITPRGTTLEMRVNDEITFQQWSESFQEIDNIIYTCKINDLYPFSDNIYNTNVYNITTSNNNNSNIINDKEVYNNPIEKLYIRVDGYQILIDNKGYEYAAFIIDIKNYIKKSSYVVLRRFTEFKLLDKKIKELNINNDSTIILPQLPHSKIWGRFESSYLKEKSVHLQGYLQKLNIICQLNKDAFYILLEFLSDNNNSK